MTSTRILVIDDDVAITVALATVLRAKGYAVATAPDGIAGIECYHTYHPHIVITDLMMPGQRGIETIEAIRRLNAEVFIIAMSGSIEALGGNLSDNTCAVGANFYLNKPFELNELLDGLSRLTIPHDQPVSR